MIHKPIEKAKGPALSPAGVWMGLAILAASGLVMVAWIAFLIRTFGR
jgi:hypothetical protein